MKALCSQARAVMFGLFLLTPALAQPPANSDLSSETLYSPAKYKLTGSPPLASVQLKPDFPARISVFTRGRSVSGGNSDIGFGVLTGADRSDWLMLTPADEKRTVIEDLGKRNWSAPFEVARLPPVSSLRYWFV